MSRGGVRPGALALAGLLALTAAEAADRPGIWSFRVRADMEARYDDNILMLSESEQDRLDPSDPNNRERFGISRPEDVIFSPGVGLTFSRSPRGGRETTIGLSATAHQNVESTVRNYQRYGLSVRQELNRSREHLTTLSVGFSRIPDYYLRQLIDLDASPPTCNGDTSTCVHTAAEYRLDRVWGEVTQEIVNRVLSVSAGYARERREYGDTFEERDSHSNVFTLETSWYPAGSIGFRLRPWYEHEQRIARGDLVVSQAIEDDVGYDADMYGIELRGLWGARDHRNTLRGTWQMQKRDFTAPSPSDPRFGREDDVARYGVEYSRELGPQWRWEVLAFHREVDISTSSSIFEKNVVAFSLGWSLEGRFADEPRRRDEDD